jgi:hypothetical protein
MTLKTQTLGRETYIDFLKKYLKEDSEAYIWLIAYAIYAHSIDDIIDNEVPSKYEWNEFLLRTFEFAEVVYSNIYYYKHITELRPLIKMASNTYMDSVQLEKSNEKWKRLAADSLRSTGNEVVLAVIELECGLEIRRKASMELREISWFTHHQLHTNEPV